MAQHLERFKQHTKTFSRGLLTLTNNHRQADTTQKMKCKPTVVSLPQYIPSRTKRSSTEVTDRTKYPDENFPECTV